MRCNKGGGVGRSDRGRGNSAKCHSIVAQLTDSAQTICRRVQDAHSLDTPGGSSPVASDLSYGVVCESDGWIYIRVAVREKQSRVRVLSVICKRGDEIYRSPYRGRLFDLF